MKLGIISLLSSGLLNNIGQFFTSCTSRMDINSLNSSYFFNSRFTNLKMNPLFRYRPIRNDRYPGGVRWTILDILPINYADVFSVALNNFTQRMVGLDFNGRSGWYMWVNLLNGKTYIGKTINFYNRFTAYRNINKIKKCVIEGSVLARAITKYGINNFAFIVLDCHPADAYKHIYSTDAENVLHVLIPRKRYLLHREGIYCRIHHPSYNVNPTGLEGVVVAVHSHEFRQKQRQTSIALGKAKVLSLYDYDTKECLFDIVGIQEFARICNTSMQRIKYRIEKGNV